MQLTELGAVEDGFPAPDFALNDPNGLLAIGGDLQPQRLFEAYQNGIFPWYQAGEPILWWSPDPRAVFTPDSLHISRSMRRHTVKCQHYRLTLNQAFPRVVDLCRKVHRHQGVWIHPEMFLAYTRLYQQQRACSVELWNEQQQLVAGMYGVRVASCFSAESMFHLETNASKLLLQQFAVQFFKAGGRLLDGQIMNPHLARLGAIEMPRKSFLEHLNTAESESLRAFWQLKTLSIGI